MWWHWNRRCSSPNSVDGRGCIAAAATTGRRNRSKEPRCRFLHGGNTCSCIRRKDKFRCNIILLHTIPLFQTPITTIHLLVLIEQKTIHQIGSIPTPTLLNATTTTPPNSLALPCRIGLEEIFRKTQRRKLVKGFPPRIPSPSPTSVGSVRRSTALWFGCRNGGSVLYHHLSDGGTGEA